MSRLAGPEGGAEPVVDDEEVESRIETLGPHPAALLIHRPTEEQYQATKARIASMGVVNPVITVFEGQCLDGNTRLRACRELSCTHLLRVKEFDPATDGEPYEYVKAQNAHRRHLSDEQRSQIDQRVEAAVALRHEGITYDEIAQKLGVSDRTVRRLIRRGQSQPAQGAGSESAGEDAKTATVINKRGQRRPRTYTPRTGPPKARSRRIKPKAASKTPSTPAGEEPTAEDEDPERDPFLAAMRQFSTVMKSRREQKPDWQTYAEEMTAQQFKHDAEDFFRRSGLTEVRGPVVGFGAIPGQTQRS
jgi:ParB-like chromosome segregation protein Spo0J